MSAFHQLRKVITSDRFITDKAMLIIFFFVEFRRVFGYIFTTGGNANRARCSFPFNFNGVTYTECTSVQKGLPWCATTSSYERDLRFGYCQTGRGETVAFLCSGVARTFKICFLGSSTTITSSRNNNPIFNRIGETATLDCRFEAAAGTSGPSTITWYKINNGGQRQRLYNYDIATSRGTEVKFQLVFLNSGPVFHELRRTF